jgi:plasmid stability protein
MSESKVRRAMADRTVTLNLPQQVYDQLQARAQRSRRRVEDEAALALAATMRSDALPADLEAALASLADLDDEALWRVSRTQPTVEDGVLLDALVDKRRRDGLSPADERLVADLIDRHDRVMVLRVEAVALLRERGRDVSAHVARA